MRQNTARGKAGQLGDHAAVTGMVSESAIPPVCSSALPILWLHQEAVILIHRKFHQITTVQGVTCKALWLVGAKE